MKIIIVFGTRPEFIKLAPVIKELKKSKMINAVVCSTGQHDKLLDEVINDFDIKIKHKLKSIAKKKSLNILSSRLFKLLDNIFDQELPDWILVQGDTSTALIASLAAHYRGIKIGHVEAGLRTNNLKNPFPEEANRQLISRISDINFAPTKNSFNNLLKENISRKKIIVTGNTIVDSIKYIINEKLNKKKSRELCIFFERKYNFDVSLKFIFVTFHRRENQGNNILLFVRLIKNISSMFPEINIILPLHLNPKVKNIIAMHLTKIKNVYLVSHLSYVKSLFLIKQSQFVISDSGGIQEEVPSFHKRIIVLRKFTERVEGVKLKIAFLLNFDEDRILKKIKILLDNNNKISSMKNPYGDGSASCKIKKFFEVIG